MADENEQAQEQEQEQPETVYLVDGAIWHDGQKFAHGAEFPASLATAEQIAALRKSGALKLPAEVLSAEDVQAQLAARDAEIARLRGLVGAQTPTPADENDAAGTAAATKRGK